MSSSRYVGSRERRSGGQTTEALDQILRENSTQTLFLHIVMCIHKFTMINMPITIIVLVYYGNVKI